MPGRGLITETIKRFRGISRFRVSTAQEPEWALDLANVIVQRTGGIEKLLVPTDLSPAIAGVSSGPHSFFDYQKGDGTRQVIAVFGTSIYRLDGDALTPTLIDSNAGNAGTWTFALSNNILFMANGVRMLKWTGLALQNWGIAAPTVVPSVGTPVAGALTLVTGRKWRYAYKNSVTGHIGTASEASTDVGPITSQKVPVTATAPADAQVDTIVWYATLDGGGDYFFHSETPVATLVINDETLDSALNQAVRAQLINDPPPVGFYLVKSHGRIYIIRLASARHDVQYSGYERILQGRPEESFPPSNRLRMSIGADELAGGGAIQPGVVVMSKSNEMFIHRGIPEDVTTDAPINFISFLEQLPWNLGAASPYAIQSTKYGLVWFSSDFTVRVYNGMDEPLDISANVYPILRSITKSAMRNIRSAFFTWAESDWFALLIPVDGSTNLNRILLFDMTPDEDNAGIMILHVAADSIGVIEDSNGERKLVIGHQGRIKLLSANSYTEQGITTAPFADGQTLPAWYRTGYFGGESPQVMKMNRFVNFVADRTGFRFTAYVVRRNDNIVNPSTKDLGLTMEELVPVNEKAKRVSYHIDFPRTNMTAAILELSNSYIPLSER